MRSVPGTKTASIWVSGLLVVSAGITGAFLGANRKAPARPGGAPEQEKQKISAAMQRLPLTFQENRGQADKSVRFLTRGAGYTFWMSPTNTTLALARLGESVEKAKAGQPVPASMMRMHMVGANPKAKMVGAGERQGTTNYLVGRDQSKWIRNVPNYTRVRYQGIYNGVDLEYYGNQQELEHDFIVKPGAKPDTIRLAYEGVKEAEITPAGELHLQTSNGVVEQKRPYSYQVVDGKRREVPSSYVLLAKNEVGFTVGDYDQSKPLVIDPILRYSTFIGGSIDDYGFDIAIDGSRNVYITGYTGSYAQAADTRPSAVPAGEGGPHQNIPALTGFPVVGGVAGGVSDDRTLSRDLSQPRNNSIDGTWNYSLYDAFVTKLNPNGNGLVFSTYLGSESDDYAFGIAVGPSSTVFVTGRTNSVFWPLQFPVQANNGGGTDGFLVKLNPEGNSFIYSTYLGGSGFDQGRSVAVDSAGNAYVAGITTSLDYPVFQAAQPTRGGGIDAFVSSINASGSTFNYSTYLGGAGDEGGAPGTFGSTDLTYIAEGNFPWSTTIPGGWGTFPGLPLIAPLGVDYTVDVAVDGQSNAYVTGGTSSFVIPKFPSANALQQANAGGYDGFVIKYAAEGTPLYATFLGGSGDDACRSIAVDAAGAAYVTGWTQSTQFPTTPGALQLDQGGTDAFITKINASAEALVYSTYLGGAGTDIGNGIAVSAGGQAYVTGTTTSNAPEFPTVNFSQANRNSARDMFAAKLRPNGLGFEYSTFVGGASGQGGDDRGMGIVVDDRGQAYIAGMTASPTYPTTLGSYNRFINAVTNYYSSVSLPNNTYGYGDYPRMDAFVTKLHSPPFAPSDLIATDVQQTSISLAWTDNSDNEDGFEIERRLAVGGNWTAVGVVGQDQVTFTSSDLVPTTLYQFRVRGFNSDGANTYYGPYSNQLTVSTLPDAPAKPSGFTAAALDTTRVRLTWVDQADNEEAYILERRLLPSGNFVIINGGAPLPASTPATQTGGTMQFTDTNLLPNTSYEYRLRSRNAAGDSATPHATAQVTTLAPAPSVAPTLTVTSLSNSELRLDWTYAVDPADNIGFKIYRKGPADAAFTLLRTTADRNTTYQDDGLESGATYCYRVLAYNASGDGPLSGPSTGECADTLPDPPVAPTNLRATLSAPNTGVLVWADNSTAPEEAGFKIEYSTDNFATAPAGELTVGSHTGTGDVAPVNVPGLQANTVYYFRVGSFASSAAGDSAPSYSNVACILTVPAAPTNLMVSKLRAGSNGTARLQISWTDGNPVTNTPSTFVVQRATDAAGPYTTISGSPTGTQGGDWSVIDTDLEGNTTYYYQVNSVNVPPPGCDPNSGGASAVVGPVSGTTNPNPPSAPLGLVVTVPAAPNGITQLKLDWTDTSDNETGFQVERSSDNFVTPGNITTLTTTNANETTFTDTGLTANTQYYYRVRATNDGGDSAYTNIGNGTTLPNPPVAPGTLSVTGVTQTTVTLAWVDNSLNETGFKVERSLDGITFVLAFTTSPNVVTYTDTGLTANTTYRYRVLATNTGGDSAPSNVVPATTLPERPSAPTTLTGALEVLSDPYALQVRLTWSDTSNNETGFKVERSSDGTNYGPITTVGAGIQTYLDTSVTADNTYSYRIVATNAGGDSTPSNVITISTPPAAPTNARLSGITNNSAQLFWNDNSSTETGFLIQRSLNQDNGFQQIGQVEANVTSFNDSGLQGNNTYFYRVIAQNAAGVSSASNVASGLTLPNPPAAPNNLTATPNSQSKITLGWSDNSANESGFKVERSTDGENFIQIGVVGPGVRTFEDSPLSIGTQYWYRVRAYNAGGDSAYSNTASATTFPTLPNGPTGLTATPVSARSITLSWKDNSTNEDSFRIERSTSSNFAQPIVTLTQSGGSASTGTYTDGGVTPNQTYYYRVVAVNRGGSSGYSNSASALTLPEAPTNLSAATQTNGSVLLTWSAPAGGAESYLVEFRNSNEAQFRSRGRTAGNVLSFTDSGLSPNSKFVYQVKASNQTGTSVPTNGIEVTIENGLASVTVAPAKVKGGNKVKLTVTLSSAAPAGGAVVSIVAQGDGKDYLNVPTTVQIPAGSSSVTVKVKAKKVKRAVVATVIATYGNSTKSTDVTIKK